MVRLVHPSRGSPCLVLLVRALVSGACILSSEGQALPPQQRPFVSPLRVTIKFTDTFTRPANAIGFIITVTNTGARVLNLYSLQPNVVLYPDVRKLDGTPAEVGPRMTGTPNINLLGFKALRPDEGMSLIVRWLDEWKFPTARREPYVVRFAYSSWLAAHTAREWGLTSFGPVKGNSDSAATGRRASRRPRKKLILWKGSVLSNAVLMEFRSDHIRVLGDWHDLEPEVKLSSLRSGWRLLKASDGRLSAPQEAHLKLIAVSETGRRAIRSSKDLAGLVTIKTKEQALEFARLFTSVKTHFLFPDMNVFEVRRGDYHQEEMFGGVTPDRFGPKGTRSLQPAEVVETNGAFVIHRDLATYPDPRTGKSKVYRAVERVSADGQYHHRIATVLVVGDLDEKPLVLLPYY
jgi:hypothetical protein